MENNRRNISKGGLIGALAGSVVSAEFYNKNDHPIKKAAKTGLFATIGYLLGTVLEKIIKLEKKS
jgi:hypothetical protein